MTITLKDYFISDLITCRK